MAQVKLTPSFSPPPTPNSSQWSSASRTFTTEKGKGSSSLGDPELLGTLACQVLSYMTCQVLSYMSMIESAENDTIEMVPGDKCLLVIRVILLLAEVSLSWNFSWILTNAYNSLPTHPSKGPYTNTLSLLLSSPPLCRKESALARLCQFPCPSLSSQNHLLTTLKS